MHLGSRRKTGCLFHVAVSGPEPPLPTASTLKCPHDTMENVSGHKLKSGRNVNRHRVSRCVRGGRLKKSKPSIYWNMALNANMCVLQL